MGTAITETESHSKPPKPPLRQRIRSWKWWVYGDVNSQPRSVAPKGFTLQIFVVAISWFVLALHPWVTTFINRHPPPFSDLNKVHGHVVFTSRLQPHLGLLTDDGKTLSMEYPVFMMNSGRPAGGPKSLGIDNDKILGCDVTVWFDIPKYTTWRRYRVWQVYCDGSRTGASYGEIANDAKRSMRLFGWGIGIFLVCPILLLIYLMRYRRGFYEQ